MTAVELAEQTGMNSDALNRILRLLAAYDVFAHEGDGYRHTPASELLRTDHPHSMISLTRMMSMPVIWNSFKELAHAAKTGKPVLDWAGIITYFAAHPEESSLFNQAMTDKSNGIIQAVIDAYDFSVFQLIADIGGGRGHLLRRVLERTPAASGVLFDLPHVIADAAGRESERMRLQPGDFFADALPATDAYLFMDVIHDWNDQDAAKILAAVRRAAPEHGRLLIIESLVSESPGPHYSKVLDVVMLAVTGGRERTASEYKALLAGEGFHLERVIPTLSQHSIMEAVAAKP
ncbi:MAG: methyltransferase [Chloracidobacterium sp.]|nr:methyltransferase [Chloracidobacterium sp.]